MPVRSALSAEPDVELTLPRTGHLVVRTRGADGSPMPSRLLVLGRDPSPPSDLLDGDGFDPFAPGVLWMEDGLDGTFDVRVEPGSIDVVVTRGPEYSMTRVPLTLGAGETREIEALLHRVVDTSGWLSGDFHVHSSPSPDSTVGYPRRVLNMASEGVEVIVATDHAFVTDYGPTIEELGLGTEVASIPGQEVTTMATGHFGPFPLPLDPEVPNHGAVDWSLRDPVATAELVLSANPDAVYQIMHPRAMPALGNISNYFTSLDLLFDETGPVPGPRAIDPTDVRLPPDARFLSPVFNAMEVVTFGNVQGLSDWFNLLNAGWSVTATGNSDTHTRWVEASGYARNLVWTGEGLDRPEALDPAAYARSLREGRNSVVLGAFVELVARGGGSTAAIGETLDAAGLERVDLEIRVQSPDWLVTDELRLYRNGLLLDTIDVAPELVTVGTGGAARNELRLTRTVPVEGDAHYVAVATGSQSLYRSCPTTGPAGRRSRSSGSGPTTCPGRSSPSRSRTRCGSTPTGTARSPRAGSSWSRTARSTGGTTGPIPTSRSPPATAAASSETGLPGAGAELHDPGCGGPARAGTFATMTPTTPRLFRSRWSALTHLFALLFVLGAATGYALLARDTLDRAYYHTLKAHVWLGYGGLLGFLVLGTVHVRSLYGPRAAWLCLLAMALFPIISISDLGPVERLAIPSLLLAWVTWKHLLPRKTGSTWVVLVGVATFALLAVVYGTGWILAAPPRVLRTGIFSAVHDVGGWVAPPLVLFHLFRGYDRETDRRWALRLAFAGVVVGGVLVWAGTRPLPAAPPADAYTTYDGRPAAPPHVRTEEESCGLVGCHTEISKQFHLSAHRFSSENLPYRKVAELAEREAGPAVRDLCRGCHEPSAGLPDPRGYPTPVGEGHVSCRACHLIDAVEHPPANGRFSFAEEVVFLPGEDLTDPGVLAQYRDFIRTDLRDHRRSYQRDLLRSASYCESCHRQVIGPELNGAAELVLEGPVASWRTSRFPGEGVSCTHCHLQLFAFEDPESSEAEHHARPDHRTFGIHAHLGEALPDGTLSEAGSRAFASATRDWLDGRLEVSSFERTFLAYTGNGRSPAYEDHFTGRPVLEMTAHVEREGADVRLRVATANRRIGHRFPVGLLDLAQVWLEIEVLDGDGGRLASTGIPGPDGRLPPDAPRLGAEVLDREGRPIEKHRIWRAARVTGGRFLAPGGSVEDELRFPVPTGAGALRYTARWRYRRYRPAFARWVFGEDATVPVLDLARIEGAIE